MKILVSTLAASVLLLSGCVASPSNSSWQEIGYKQSASGLPQQTVEDLQTRYDLAAVEDGDYSEYMAGFEEGRMKFCNPKQAFRYGTWGNRYKGQCEGLPQAQQVRDQMELGYQNYVFSDDY